MVTGGTKQSCIRQCGLRNWIPLYECLQSLWEKKYVKKECKERQERREITRRVYCEQLTKGLFELWVCVSENMVDTALKQTCLCMITPIKNVHLISCDKDFSFFMTTARMLCSPVPLFIFYCTTSSACRCYLS